jgi:uncharacterized protein YjbI with pentapeptide repeats
VANDEHLALLRQGTATWNEWRRRDASVTPDLSSANLVIRDLMGMDFSWAYLADADLSFAKLSGASLSLADLTNANLRHSDLSDANLRGADLIMTHFQDTKLSGTEFSAANFGGTILADVDLGQAVGLNDAKHIGPSIVDFRTLVRSANLPISFLRGCGLPENFIEYLSSLRGEAIQFYSCFISYSNKDQVFADRLHADLKNKGVRCWFAPHDLPVGAKTWDAIDEAIRVTDKLLLILSKASIASEWVEDEVNKAYAEERARKEIVLFPIRIDNTLMSTAEPWAVKLRDQRNIGDFRQWETPAEYQKSLDRLLRDLKASGAQ